MFRNRTSKKNAESTVYQHDRPLASSLDFLDHSICEIDGDDDLAVSRVEACEVNLGADTHDVRRLMLAECRIACFSYLLIRMELCL